MARHERASAVANVRMPIERCLQTLKAAQQNVCANLPDMLNDGDFRVEQIAEEVRLYDALSYILNHADDLRAATP